MERRDARLRRPCEAVGHGDANNEVAQRRRTLVLDATQLDDRHVVLLHCPVDASIVIDRDRDSGNRALRHGAEILAGNGLDAARGARRLQRRCDHVTPRPPAT